MMGNPIDHRQAPWIGLASLSHAITPEADYMISLRRSCGTSTASWQAPRGGTLPVVGGLIVAMGYDGGSQVIGNTFNFFDLNNGEGQVNEFNGDYWDKTFPDGGATRDWIHDNAVAVDPTDDTIVVSSHTQSWIYKIRRDGTLVWRLGAGGDFTLTNPGDGWQYGQHGSYVTPSGTIMLFDDGEHRPLKPGEKNFSRAMEYQLDTQTMQATIIWQYNDNFASYIYGSVYKLESKMKGETNVLIDDGCELQDKSGVNVDPNNQKSLRVLEVTYATPAEKLAEVDINVPIGGYKPDPAFSGFTAYRAYKWPSLY